MNYHTFKERLKHLRENSKKKKEKQSLNKIDEYLTNLKVINDKNFLYLTFNNEEMDILKTIMDALAK